MLRAAINKELIRLTGLSAFWLSRPNNTTPAIVYTCIAPGEVDAGLVKSGIRRDVYSVSIYHTDPDAALTAAEAITSAWNNYTGALADYAVELIEFESGSEQPLESDGVTSYLFTRDFTFYH